VAAVTLGPASVDITGVRAGDLNQISFTVHSKGTPVDLTGLTVTAQARTSAVSNEVALTAVIDVTDAPAGKGTMRWPGDEVRDLLAGAAKWSGVWDMQADNNVDDPTTLCAGKFEAVMDVTRP
jgi:hypothetical protein